MSKWDVGYWVLIVCLGMVIGYTFVERTMTSAESVLYEKRR